MSKSKALVYIHSFFPYEDANTVAALPLIEQLRQDFDVEILACDRDGCFGEFSEYNEMKIRWFRKDNGIVYKATQWKHATLSNLKPLKKAVMTCKKIAAKIILSLAAPNNIGGLKKALKSYAPQMLISFSAPVWTHFAAHEVLRRRKFKNIRWLAVFHDPYAGYVGNAPVSSELYSKMEKILKPVSAVCIGPEFYNEQAKKVLKAVGCKVLPLPVTSLREQSFPPLEDKNTDITEDTVIRLAYVGGLQDERVRDPERAFKLISECKENICFRLTVNNFNAHCRMLFTSHGLDKKPNVSLSGGIPHDECLTLIKNSDILINIGNNISNQLPSKIVEYLSFGKPIVHFCNTPQDPVNKLLARYPLSLIISQPDIDNELALTVKRFEQFCRENKNRKIPFNEIRQIYPELVTEKIQADFRDLYRSII